MPILGSWGFRATYFVVATCCIAGCHSSGPAATVKIAPDNTAITNSYSLTRPVPFHPQETAGTCWLACARMVYAYYGTELSEVELRDRVNRLTGSTGAPDEEASERECMLALAQQPGLLEKLNAQIHTVNNGHWSVHLETNPAKAILSALQQSPTQDFNQLTLALTRQEPVVVVCKIGPWASGTHAMIATCANFGGISDAPQLVSIQVLDPAQTGDGIRILTAEYIQANLVAIYSRSVCRKILEGELETVHVSS